MKNFKFWGKVILYLIICFILLMLIFQNSNPVEFRFLGFLFSSPLVFLLLICIILGFILGLFTVLFIYPKDRDKKISISKENKKDSNG